MEDFVFKEAIVTPQVRAAAAQASAQARENMAALCANVIMDLKAEEDGDEEKMASLGTWQAEFICSLSKQGAFILINQLACQYVRTLIAQTDGTVESLVRKMSEDLGDSEENIARVLREVNE